MKCSDSLQNSHVTLIPLEPKHKEALYAVSQDKRIWTWMIDQGMGKTAFDHYFDIQCQLQLAGTKIPFVVQLPSGDIVGFTSYLNIDDRHKRLEVGSTWYHPKVWGTLVNPAAKYELFHYAFETLGVNRVQLCADTLNLRSQAAIVKIGAKKEGILRAHMVVQDGRVRDTAVYGITLNEWNNTLKAYLENRIGATRPLSSNPLHT